MKTILSATALAVLTAGAAHAATLTGDTVDVSWTNTGSDLSGFDTSVTVGAGTDYSVGVIGVDLDFNTGADGNGVVMTIPQNTWCGMATCDGTETTITFSDLDFSGGETLVGFDLVAGDLNPDVTFTSSSVSFTFQETFWSATTGTTFSGTFITAAAVPLPAAGWLILSGLGALAIARRRKAS